MTSVQTRTGIDIARMHIKAFSESDWDTLMSLATPDCTYEEIATGLKLDGPSQIVEGLKSWKNAFPDLKGTITGYTGDNRSLAIELTWDGRFTGQLMTPNGMISGNGATGSIRAAQFIAFANERISSTRHYFDLNSILMQAGANQ